MIMSNILNDLADIDQIIQYYKNVLGRPVPEFGLANYEIRNPAALLEQQVIKDIKLFNKLLGNLIKLSPKLIKILLENYSNDKMKLLSIYYTLSRLDYRSEAKKMEGILEDKLSLEDLESFIYSNEEVDVIDKVSMLYINLLGMSKPTDINLEILRQVIMFIEDIDLKDPD